MMPSDIQKTVIGMACAAVTHEILAENTPVSIQSGPDGAQKPETMPEQHKRIVVTAIMYCLEQGLLVVPEDLEDQFVIKRFPLQRDNRDGIPGIRLADGTYTT